MHEEYLFYAIQMQRALGTRSLSHSALTARYPELASLQGRMNRKPKSIARAKGLVTVDGDTVTITTRGLLLYERMMRV